MRDEGRKARREAGAPAAPRHMEERVRAIRELLPWYMVLFLLHAESDLFPFFEAGANFFEL